MLNSYTNKKLLVVAGEVSGDLHGSSLISALKNIDKDIEIYGIGGDKMNAAGMQLSFHINSMAFLGFLEVVKHIPYIKKVQKNLIELIKQKNIKNVVLIDYPGFNLNFAKRLKALNVKIIYYISPQIWAWGAGRIKKIKRLVDKMLVVFPFEESFYKHAGVNVQFVGHPILERINSYNFLTKEELIKKFDLINDKDILLVLAGSRYHEVKKIFPESIKAANKLAEKFNLQVVVACSSNIDQNIFKNLAHAISFKVIKGHTYDLFKHAKFGIIKSGTSTLEAGLFQLPMVIVYKTSYLTYLIGSRLIKLKNIGLVNIVLGKKIVPELIQDMVSEHNIYNECRKILADNNGYAFIKNKLAVVKDKLGTIGASQRAAETIYAMINEN